MTDRKELYELIGMEGNLAVECGRTAPVIRRKADNMFAKVLSDGTISTWHDPILLVDHVQMQRTTRFVEPQPLPESVVSLDGNELMPMTMVYVTQLFMTVTGMHCTENSYVGSNPVMWYPLEEEGWAACLACEAATTLLDEWAGRIKVQLDNAIKAGNDAEWIKSLSDVGLCAAVSPQERWNLYIRHGVALSQQYLKGIFDTFIRHEFPTAVWANFVQEVSMAKGGKLEDDSL